uniref:recombinase family protein n=1 Tax=uncultured Tyzzerella sp. TaxID=2321398 RepID=UPI0029423815
MLYNIAMYTRLSKEDINKSKIESESIVNQKLIIENFIKNNDELKGSNIISYSDDGYVGSNFERPDFKKMIQDIKDKKINCIIVKDLSRFGRNYIEVNNYLDKIFPFLNIRFIAINDNYDSKNNKNVTTDLDIAFKNILYSYYSKDLSIKVKTGMKAKAKQGNYISSYAPFGYKKNKETKRLEIDEETAPIVKMIFQLVLENNTYSGVCKILNENKVPVKSDFKIAKGIRKEYSKKLNNKIWKANDIKVIIDNEIYIGNTIYFKRKKVKCGSGKTIKNDDIVKVCNTHEPIIDKETFYMIKSKTVSTYKNLKPKMLFVYKFKCGNCGYGLRYTNVYKNKEVINKKYYCHSIKENDNNCCKEVKILESEIKEIVFESLKKEILLYIKNQDDLEDKTNLKKNVLILEKEQEELIFSRRLIYEDYINEKISKEEYLKLKREKEQLITNLKNEIEKVKNISLENKEIREENKILRNYLKEDVLTKEMVDIFIDKIYIYDRENIKIDWKFKK